MDRSLQVKLQGVSLCMILLPPVGLYFTAPAGSDWATWTLMGLVSAGMLLALWVS
jgi:hypothetical protein